MNINLIGEMKKYFDDHINVFNCYPVEFEFNGVVFDYDECTKILECLKDEQM